jgi:Ca-activated chloride channel family protein
MELAAIVVLTVGFALAVQAQVIDAHHHGGAASRPWAANVVVPQARSFVPASSGAGRAIEIAGVEVGVVILEQSATTTLDISLRNLTGARQEAELLVPVPAGAVVRTFTFEGAAQEPTAEILPKPAAESAYAGLVAKVRDPALLEFAGCNLVRSSVFPLAPNGTHKVRLTYEHLLAADGARVDYELPRSESLEYGVPWTIAVRIKAKRPIATVYSPSHAVQVKRDSPNVVSARLAPAAKNQPGPFRLSYLLEGDGISASLFAYPDPKTGGGYFLLLAGAPASLTDAKGASAIKRDVVLVLDRSGSMNGPKLEQVREAALQVLEGLAEGEAFNIILYNDSVETFAPGPVLKTVETMAKARGYLKAVVSRSGTNIHDALTEALRLKPAEGMLPIVLFLTDGLPTVGQTSEAAIRDLALKANSHGRRIFTFGVGVDVNTPLLEKIAAETRAVATFVLPKEDVEVKVGQVFKRLAGPVLADPRVEVAAEIKASTVRVTEVLPRRLPDLFEDDQVVLLGRYAGGEPLEFRLTGNCLGRQRTFKFRFALDGATTRNAFVPRLWASRKIGDLTDAIRQMGAGGPPKARAALASADPRLKELTDEVVRLSTEFGILTEYTAFLAREGTDLSKRDQVLAEAVRNFQDRAIATRSGLASVNQDMNLGSQRVQAQLNARNEFYNQNMDRVAVASVQQVADRAFYQRGGRWVDSRLINEGDGAPPPRTIEFGSVEYRELVDRLTKENRVGTIAMRGDVMMVVDGERVLVKAPANP